MNYRGYFKSLSNISYQVDIIADSSTTAYTEVIMGATPFVVNYNESSTPFDSSRISTASISIVADEYLTSVVTSHAQGTIVRLTDLTNNAVKWAGYLKPNLYNQGYSNEYETIELEASDCLASLQYLKYETVSADSKSIVTIKNILDRICDKCGQLTRWEITKSKKHNNSFVTPNMLKVSEQNFFSSDTDEAWKLSDVLDEICKYLGYTAIQWGTVLYLVDYQYFHNNNKIRTYFFSKSEGYNTIHEHNLAVANTITAASYKGSNGDISFESIYNKAKVNCNFYEVTDFLPDIFNQEDLTNRYGENWQCKEIPLAYDNRYYNSKLQHEFDAPDTAYRYYNKTYDSSHYESVYRNPDTLSAETVASYISTELLQDSESNTGFTLSCRFTNNDSVSHTIECYAEYNHTYWNILTEKAENQYVKREPNVIFTLAPNASSAYTITLVNDNPKTVKYEIISENFIEWYKVDNSNFSNSMRFTNDVSLQYIGGTIVDFANISNNFTPDNYNYETASDISFTKYLLINQSNKPSDVTHPAYIPQAQIDGKFPCIFKLKSGHTMPVVFNENSFLAIDASAVFERYPACYINPDWTTESTGINGGYNVTQSGGRKIESTVPCLIFKLGIGDKYWNGSAWTTDNVCFYANMSTDVTEGNTISYANLWNNEHHILNNVSWEEWAGVNGYKIPLDTTLDMNGEITFEIHMPSRMQNFVGTTPDNGIVWLNNMCWLKTIKISIGTKGSENFDKTDCIYENIIDDDSINELDEIVVKLTTYPDNGKMSYSNVQLDNSLLTTIREDSISGVEQKPEENIIEKYVNQYSTLTKKETITTDMSFTPLQKIVDSYWNENFVMLGQQINYADDNENITIIQIK